MSHNHIRASKIPDTVDRSKNSNNALKPPHKKIQNTDVKKNGKINASEQLQWNQYDLHGHCLIVHILISVLNCEKQQSRGVLRKKYSKNMQHIHRSAPMPKCDLNKVAEQLYWNRTSAWVFSCKFAVYFQNNFF